MNRAQRRRLDRQIEGLMGGDGCSVCGATFEHNARLFGGCDGYGRPAITGDCCSEVLAQVTHAGINTKRSYDFLERTKKKDPRRSRPSSATEIISAIATCRDLIEDADQQLDGMARRAGVRGPLRISVLDSPWKADDRVWFEQHPERSHRARLAFPGEANEVVARAPTGTVLLMLIRQVEPGKRVRAGFFINAGLWAPEIEAVAHVLFDIATGQQAQPRDAAERSALVEQYHVAGRGH